MQPILVAIPACTIIGFGNIGKPTDPGDVWPALFSRINDITDRVNPHETIGLIKRNELGYLAGVKTASNSEVPEGMSMYPIPAGQYAGVTHRGPVSKINETFEKLTDWLGANHYEPFDVVCFEVYDERFKHEQDDSELDMFIQLKPV
ncbi:AraC family transcriptional regulator [Paenibacillus lycopersici]|uniref:AraC family transcriptional regulator n=1 Tax=Paenibacillus lycopersici TaxID=2704462 RepID=A0A6C0G067_9BACL|nr:GyrI-like domain-containing protein [Paenibacillus lycopersici]QHT61213.1 AraC family transcriptional regulator [Paenibacillus lycopersici]